MRSASTNELTQLKPNERAALQEYLDRLEARFADRVLHVFLYGSRARGEGDDESDLDVLVVVDDGDWRFHDEVAAEANEPALEYTVSLSVHVWSEEHYEKHKRWGLLFYRNLESDGISLWTDSPKLQPSNKDSHEPMTISKQHS